jgi:predicted CopG family antitoxin
MAKTWTTMSVHQEVYEQVKASKRGGESFNDVLVRLCEFEDPHREDE